MEKINQEKLKKIQLEILDFVHNFCVKNGINYWLDSGTLIGAVRHKGYIPWDDDIDIGMLRPDYDRFLKEFNASNDRYKVNSVVLDSSFTYPFAKVLDTQTVLYEPTEKGRKTCINIDVFVFDNAPDDDKIVKKMYDKRDRYQKLNFLRNYSSYSKNFLKNFVGITSKLFLSVFPKGHFAKKMAIMSNTYSTVDTKRIGNFTAYVRFTCPKEVFSDFIEVEFEGKLYKAPIGYDTWLRKVYGDYMQLPPEEKRISHHSFVAYAKDE